MQKPIIILGAARSGTKILRDVLGASEFIKTVPYDVSYIWRHGNESQLDDALSERQAGPAQKVFIRKHLCRLAKLTESENAHLLEKTVGNTLRVDFVNAIFPDAKYIHLIRDGRAVSESAMRMWNAPPDYRQLLVKLKSMPFGNARYGAWFARNFIKGLASGRQGGRVWGPRYPGIFEDESALPLSEVCAKQWAHSISYTRASLDKLDPGRVFEMRYEDFVRQPQRILDLADFLSLPDPGLVQRSYEANVESTSVDKWRQRLSLQDQQCIERVAGETLCELGYVDDRKD
jgi:Sulfotransferase family